MNDEREEDQAGPKGSPVAGASELVAVMETAQHYAQLAGAKSVTRDHLFLALLGTRDPLTGERDDTSASLVLEALDVGVGDFSDLLKSRLNPAGAEPNGVHLPLDPTTADVLGGASEIAVDIADTEVDAAIVLIALLSDNTAPMAYGPGLLHAQGIDGTLVAEAWTDLRSTWQLTSSPAGDAPVNAKAAYSEFTTDLTLLARAGALDPVIGRDAEVARVMQILARRTKNNAALIGEPGVGKTAIAEGLAQRIVSGNCHPSLRGKRVVALITSNLVAGTKFRGEFEERVKKLVDGIVKSGDVILFIDEFHSIVGAGASIDSSNDLANTLKPVLARGELRCVAATTLDEYREYIEPDPALERRFQPVIITEPSEAFTREILEGLAGTYAGFHRVTFEPAALDACVAFAGRYVSGRLFPDKAIDLMDEAASRVTGSGLDRVDVAAVAGACAAWTKVPEEAILASGSPDLATLSERLSEAAIGQDAAAEAIASIIRSRRLGLSPRKSCLASFVLVGPPGSGKTVLATALAAAAFGGNIVNLNLTAFAEEHSISGLVGTPPGYVGWEQPARLVEPIRRAQASVVNLEHADLAHQAVRDLIAEILETGSLTDTHGAKASFRDAVVILTVSDPALTSAKPAMGFGTAATSIDEAGLATARRALGSTIVDELVDRVVTVPALSESSLQTIVARRLSELSAKTDGRTFEIRLDPAVASHITARAPRATGARPLERLVSELVEEPIAAAVLAHPKATIIEVSATDGMVTVTAKDPA